MVRSLGIVFGEYNFEIRTETRGLVVKNCTQYWRKQVVYSNSIGHEGGGSGGGRSSSILSGGPRVFDGGVVWSTG